MKLSQVDKAIAQLESEKQVIEMAIQRLRAQQTPAKPKKAKPLAVPNVAAAGRAS